jgi:protoporphyrinogen oxidase
VLEAARALTFRNTILVYLHVGATDLFPDQWLYIHAPELKTGRVTNFRNWVPSLHGGQPSSILALEYWCTGEEPIWRATEEDLVSLAGDELRRTGLLGGAPVLEGKVVRVPRCYPVYRRGYREPLKVVEAHLRTIPRLQVIGRYGAFKYNNQDHSILMGRLAAENVLGGAGHDVWSVNTDYDTYQERSVITSAGLVPDVRAA